jgi:uncharacterized protein (AIM24 family)
MSIPLPAGWQCLETAEGRPYYYNATTKETTWTPPAAAAAPPAAAVLPASQAAAAAVEGRYTMSTLVQKTTQRDLGQGFFELERDKLLEINLTGSNTWAWIKVGSMVARRGNVKFTRQGIAEQGLSKLIMKNLTGEGMKLVKCEGQGKVFCADQGKTVSVVQLNNESVSVNGNDVLALSGSLNYDITLMAGAGMAAGGLFNCRVAGSGMLSFTCHGSVVSLAATPENPVYTDPNATVAWTHDPSLKADISLEAVVLGRGTGEEFQLCFTQGYVFIQPYEEIVTLRGGASGGGGVVGAGKRAGVGVGHTASAFGGLRALPFG